MEWLTKPQKKNWRKCGHAKRSVNVTSNPTTILNLTPQGRTKLIRTGYPVNSELSNCHAILQPQYAKLKWTTPTAHTGIFSAALHKSLDDQPFTTLAIAAAMGFVLGAIWRS